MLNPNLYNKNSLDKKKKHELALLEVWTQTARKQYPEMKVAAWGTVGAAF